MPINNTVILSYSDVFSDENKSKFDYLNLLPVDELKLAGAFFINASKPGSPHFDPSFFLGKFFCEANQGVADLIFEKILGLQNAQSQVLILNPLSSLQIAEYSLRLEENNVSNISDQEFEEILIKAYLKFNEENIHDEEIKNSVQGYMGNDQFAARTLLSIIAYHDLINYNIYDVIVSQFIKAIYLFEFLEQNSSFKPILNKFLQNYSYNDWKEYLQKIMPAIYSIADKAKKNPFTYTDIRIDDSSVESFYALHSFESTDDFSRNIDFIKLRDKPFYKIGDGNYRVISDLFLAEKLYNSLYFSLNQANSTLADQDKISFRSRFCHEFTENFLFYRAIENIYEKKYLQMSGQSIIEKFKIDSEPDYYIRNGNKVFLFESKDVLINAEVKVSYDFEKIEQALKEKFYFDIKKGKKHNKAVLQLMNNIKNILNEDVVFDKNVKARTSRVYPIIVTYYNTLNTPGINYWVNRWHLDELNQLRQAGLTVQNVRKITIINIDTLLIYANLFKERKISLDVLIDEYHKLGTLKVKKTTTQLSLKKEITNRYIPFDSFIYDYCEKRGFKVAPKLFLEIGMKMLEDSNV